MARILVTGASGFVGSFIVSEGLKVGHEMWAGMRRSSSRQYLSDDRIRFAELDLSSLDTLRHQLSALRSQMGGTGWDYVVHAAGATKSRTRDGFFHTNTLGTQNLVSALIAEGMVPRRFVFVSSLSVFGPVREEPVPTPSSPFAYAPILLDDTPSPNTAYGESKLKAEEFLRGTKDFPYVILRPTGVYGPREKDYFLMAKSIVQHVDFAVGFKKQEITFIYVLDLVRAIYLALEAEGVEGGSYFLTDGCVYDSRRFSDLLQKELGVKHVLHITAPLWFLRLVCAVSGAVSGWFGKMSTLNLDKYHILSQRNWQCDIEPARRDLGYQPQWQLERGVAESVRWYKENGLL